jgi:Lar family restriction alleviation protein
MDDKDKKPELLPCPFCGGKDLVIREDKSGDEPEDDPTDQRTYAYHVFCRGCHAHGRNNYPIGWCESEQAAIEAWNDRFIPATVPGEAEDRLMISSTAMLHIRNELDRIVNMTDHIQDLLTPIQMVMKKENIHMQTRKDKNPTPVKNGFVSKINPKPDPLCYNESGETYKEDLAAYKGIERLAAIEHDQWCFWSQRMMPELDEMITAISDVGDHHLVKSAKTAGMGSFHLAVGTIAGQNDRTGRLHSLQLLQWRLPRCFQVVDRGLNCHRASTAGNR